MLGENGNSFPKTLLIADLFEISLSMKLVKKFEIMGQVIFCTIIHIHVTTYNCMINKLVIFNCMTTHNCMIMYNFMIMYNCAIRT